MVALTLTIVTVTPLALGSVPPGRDQRLEGQCHRIMVPSLRPAQCIPACVEGTVVRRPRFVVAGRVRAGRRTAAGVHPVDADVLAHLGSGRLNYRGAAHGLVVAQRVGPRRCHGGKDWPEGHLTRGRSVRG